MLHIFLLLLKILGILLLVILGILLFLVLVVLFVPVRYRGNVSFHGEPRGNVLVSWLLHVLTARLTMDESLKLCVKVLWFKLFEETLWSKEEDEGPKEDLSGEELSREEVPEEDFGEVISDFEEEEPQMVHMAEVSGGEPEPDAEPECEPEPEPEPKWSGRPEQSPEPGLCRLWKKIKAFISGGQASFKKARKKYETFTAFVEDEENQKTFRLLVRQTKKLFKCILPRKVEGRIRFGFEDPYYTGKILTIISPFYGLYAKTLAVEPVFEEKALEGELKIKGRIRAASILFVGLRVFMNKNFRRLLKKWGK